MLYIGAITSPRATPLANPEGNLGQLPFDNRRNLLLMYFLTKHPLKQHNVQVVSHIQILQVHVQQVRRAAFVALSQRTRQTRVFVLF